MAPGTPPSADGEAPGEGGNMKVGRRMRNLFAGRKKKAGPPGPPGADAVKTPAAAAAPVADGGPGGDPAADPPARRRSGEVDVPPPRRGSRGGGQGASPGWWGEGQGALAVSADDGLLNGSHGGGLLNGSHGGGLDQLLAQHQERQQAQPAAGQAQLPPVNQLVGGGLSPAPPSTWPMEALKGEMASRGDAASAKRGEQELLLRQKSYVDEAEMSGYTLTKEKLWKLCCTYLPRDVPSLQKSVVQHVEYTLARRRYKHDIESFYQATAHSVRDRLIERWTDTQQFVAARDAKRVYYLSMEFLIGRSLQMAMINLGLKDNYQQALLELGYDLEHLIDEEKDPALGNGGLGRLASCFLDSLGSLNFPAWGYGIRYKYGMFEQRFVQGKQAESPDYWLTRGNPWEVERLDVQYPVRMYGSVRPYVHKSDKDRTCFAWEGGEVVLAVAYDTPVPGYNTWNANNMRLWSSKPYSEFDLKSFNDGQYYAAIEQKERCESITSVLYPNDNVAMGKELRLRQQYFFVSATLQDILRRFKKHPRKWSQFPEKVAIQLNDTHPAIAIPELMRLLLDVQMLEWDEAWDVTRQTFAYTNHTILPEALEKWPVPLLEKMLPRHMQIIYEINHHFLKEVEAMWPGDTEKLNFMSMIEESDPKQVRMANLAIVGSHTINGVAEIHTNLIRTQLFQDFNRMFPDRFLNITNGVNHRRWILSANPSLTKLLRMWLKGDDWIQDLNQLAKLERLATNQELHNEWQMVRQFNKLRLALYVERECGVKIDCNALFDVQVKRIHEYKRQLLNILGVIHRYHSILTATPKERPYFVPRVIVFAGKAAPGYFMAKSIIQLILAVSNTINTDQRVGDLLKVVFIPNYNVSLAELIIPASDVSQHISTAGMEASGTSNMKFAMNGGLLLGTRDGANIEIARAIGGQNMFTFGATAEEADAIRSSLPYRQPTMDDQLAKVLSLISGGVFGEYEEAFKAILKSLEPQNDKYLVSHDFTSYLEAQAAVDNSFMNRKEWLQKSIRSTASMGWFSSDRTVKEYAEKVWRIEPQAFRPPYRIVS